MKLYDPRVLISRRYALPTALGAVIVVLALAPAASAKTRRCGETTLAGTSQKAFDITASGRSCKAAKSVIEDFARAKTPKAWKATSHYIASVHSLKWTLTKGSEAITFEVRKTS